MNAAGEVKISVADVINNCTRMIERQEIVAGVGNELMAPLVSIVLGAQAEKNLPVIQTTYDAYWSSIAEKTEFCVGGCTPKDIEEACARSVRQGNLLGLEKRDVLKLAWYWDIMDDRFEEFFDAVKGPCVLPLGCTGEKIFFLFCSQMRSTDQAITQERLTRLFQWGNETGNTLMVFSDQSAGASLADEDVGENYHLAATILMMTNTKSSNEYYSADIAQQLSFKLKDHMLWTAGYSVGKRPYRDIINVSLLKIIERGIALGTEQRGSQWSQDGFFNSEYSYLEFLDEVFQEALEKFCPPEDQRIFLEDLPKTQDMQALAQYLAQEPETGGRFGSMMHGLLSKLRRNNSGSWQNAVNSLGDFWTCCVKLYYVDPVCAYLKSEAGSRAVMDTINNMLARKCLLKDMTMLSQEAEKLRSGSTYQDAQFPDVYPVTGESVSSYLHRCACREAKNSIYNDLIRKLASAMDQMCRKAKGFMPLMKTVHSSFSNSNYSQSIMNVYGDHMKRLLEGNDELFRQKFLPCDTESDLLKQMQDIFMELIRNDPSKQYFSSLYEDIQFQIAHGFANAEKNIVSRCFHMDLKSQGRFRSYSANEGILYCIMNDSMTNLLGGIQSDQIGNKFVINRSDRIERIYLYSIDEKMVQFSNG